jgi:hypothetical protein
LLQGAVELPIHPHASDIMSYVESRIKDNGPFHYCITPELEKEIINTVKDKYSNM